VGAGCVIPAKAGIQSFQSLPNKTSGKILSDAFVQFIEHLIRWSVPVLGNAYIALGKHFQHSHSFLEILIGFGIGQCRLGFTILGYDHRALG